jgi:hypothetical protein
LLGDVVVGVQKEPGRPGRKKKEPAPAATATAEDAEEEKPAKKRRVAGKKVGTGLTGGRGGMCG